MRYPWQRFVMIFLVAGWTAPSSVRSHEAPYFLSPQGNDGWSGTRPVPSADKKDGPFATLARAQQAVRHFKPNAKPGLPITVLVRGGRYELREPIRFSPEDSGTAQMPIVYAASINFRLYSSAIGSSRPGRR